jgi:transcriptional regulator with XRE-family HTH domain
MRRADAIRILREQADLNQTEVSRAAGLSQSRLSLIESNLVKPTDEEIRAIRAAIVELSDQRQAQISKADPRLSEALATIARSPAKSRLLEDLQEQHNYSETEAAIAILGRRYPAR